MKSTELAESIVRRPVEWAKLCDVAKEEAVRMAGCRVVTHSSVLPGTILVATGEPATQASSATYAVRVSFATGLLPADV